MRCTGIKAGGGQCKNDAIGDTEFCAMHDPERAAQRREYASRGGKRKAELHPGPISAELTRLQAVFEHLAERIEAGEVDRGTAAVMIQAYNGARSCIVGALKAKEQEELAKEVAEITSMLQERGIKWRA